MSCSLRKDTMCYSRNNIWLVAPRVTHPIRHMQPVNMPHSETRRKTSTRVLRAAVVTSGGLKCVLLSMDSFEHGMNRFHPLHFKQDNCCTGRIEDSGDMCSVTGAAPCIMDDIPVPGASCVTLGRPVTTTVAGFAPFVTSTCASPVDFTVDNSTAALSNRNIEMMSNEAQAAP